MVGYRGDDRRVDIVWFSILKHNSLSRLLLLLAFFSSYFLAKRRSAAFKGPDASWFVQMVSLGRYCFRNVTKNVVP